MKRGSEEIKDETSPSPSPTKHLRCRDINIPLDLTVEILKKLPAKSLIRFQCVSKQWSLIIGSRRDFIDSIVTRSLTQPPRDTHLISHHYISLPRRCDFFTVSSTYTQSTYKIKSVATLGQFNPYVRGLILCCRSGSPAPAICNPTTRQFLSLPEMKSWDISMGYHLSNSMDISTGYFFIGYEPFENQYKVLCLRTDMWQVFTLGDPIKEWRNIQCNTNIDFFPIKPAVCINGNTNNDYFPILPAVCINGTIYFRATKDYGSKHVLIMSFDVRFENLYQGEAPKLPNHHRSSTLINYHGRLGYIGCCKNSIEIWVMEEAEKKQEWSKIIFYEMEGFGKWCIAGATRCGEIVFFSSLLKSHKTFYLYYYDPKRNSLRRRNADEGIMVEDTKYRHKKYLVVRSVVLDHVENTMRL